MSNFMILEREILILHMESTISFIGLEASTKCSFQEGEFLFVDEANYVCFPTHHKTL
jgi:hypothetical protein